MAANGQARWIAGSDSYGKEHITLDDGPPIPAESPGQFWDEDHPDLETMRANDLTDACSASAKERRRSQAQKAKGTGSTFASFSP